MSELKCDKALKLIIVGEGGQGVQTVAKLLAKAGFEMGYHTSYIPNFGTEQRGGLSISFVQVSCDEIVSPKFQTADVFILLSSRDTERTLRYIGPETTIIYDRHLVNKKIASRLESMSDKVAGIDAFNTAIDKLTERSLNIIILGTLVGIVDPELIDVVTDQMNQKFKKYYIKRPKLQDLNNKALEIGLNLAGVQS